MKSLFSAFGLVLALVLAAGAAGAAAADDLFRDQGWAGMASDRVASQIGDALIVVVYQNAEARNSARNASQSRSVLEGRLRGGSMAESGDLTLGGAFNGSGETRRSESFVTQISVTIEAILPNGDYVIAGEQLMKINGEETAIRVRGRVRPSDISAGNEVLSTRIADAEIDYDGRGFVSRASRPSPLHRIFSFLGLG